MLQRGLEFLLKGGWIMWPLFACAVASVAVMLERFISIRRASTDTEALLENAKKLIAQNKTTEALALCENTRGPVAAILASGIRNRHLDNAAIERSMEELALRETPLLHKRLGVLDTVITMSPLLGLLGTITGMIQAFNVVAGPNAANQTAAITGGVGEALIATATGLAIAIATLPIYNYLTEKVKEVISDMEVRATQLLNFLASQRDLEARNNPNRDNDHNDTRAGGNGVSATTTRDANLAAPRARDTTMREGASA